MKVIDPGHAYKLAVLDPPSGLTTVLEQELQFVKRNNPPEKYPGNVDSYPGTTIQEVCRALIDRCKYVNNQERSGETEVCITYLRKVIIELETRAARRHKRKEKLQLSQDIENMPTCRNCGHIGCNETCRQHPVP